MAQLANQRVVVMWDDEIRAAARAMHGLIAQAKAWKDNPPTAGEYQDTLDNTLDACAAMLSCDQLLDDSVPIIVAAIPRPTRSLTAPGKFKTECVADEGEKAGDS